MLNPSRGGVRGGADLSFEGQLHYTANPGSNTIPALGYAIRGWNVLPLHSIHAGRCTCGNPHCQSVAKHPITLRGFKDASSDTATIEKWWRQWKSANIGIATGSASGFFVLDVDAKGDGDRALAELIRTHDEFPATIKANTGGGGNHYFFRYPPGISISNSAGKLGPGLDIRGEGGYIVAPPSLHVSGRRYEWAPYCSPDEADPAQAPNWLMKLVREQPRSVDDYARGKQEGWADVLRQGVAEGARNDTAARLAGYLLRRWLSASETFAILSLWNAQNRPPLDEAELRQIVTAVANREIARRGRAA